MTSVTPWATNAETILRATSVELTKDSFHTCSHVPPPSTFPVGQHQGIRLSWGLAHEQRWTRHTLQLPVSDVHVTLAPVGLGTTRLAAQDGDRGVETLRPAASEIRTGIPGASTVNASTGTVRVIGVHIVGPYFRAVGPCCRAHLGVSHRQRPIVGKE